MPKNAFDSLADVKILNPAFITGFKVLIVYIIYVITLIFIYLFTKHLFLRTPLYGCFCIGSLVYPAPCP